MSLQDDDTVSMKSYGSHINRGLFKDESHKGSAETLDGEEKRDVSKEECMDERKWFNANFRPSARQFANVNVKCEYVYLMILDLDDEAEGEESLGDDDIIIHAEEDELIEEGPMDCLPEACYKKFPIFAGDEDSPFWQGWGNLRLKTFRLIENKYFETAVITMILLSSMALVCT